MVGALRTRVTMHSRARTQPWLTWRAAGLVTLLAAPLIVLLAAAPPITQDPAYHALADTRTLFGIPNFWNVMSNLAFLAVAGAGLHTAATRGVNGAASSWIVFFLGLALVAPGSAYYHWDPHDATLVWDRLPMTVAFTSVLIALVSEHTDEKLERTLLAPAVVLGVASVLWWHYTGDLRIYVWIQLAPLLGAAYLLAAFPARYSHRAHLLYALVLYALAKAAELQDAAIFTATHGIVSGHTVKHLFAALAVYALYSMVRKRRPLPASPPAPRPPRIRPRPPL
jgi:hypothetical protein